TPRTATWLWPGPRFWIWRPATLRDRSSIVVAPERWICCWVWALIEKGTSWRFTSRLVAVTTISWSPCACGVWLSCAKAGVAEARASSDTAASDAVRRLAMERFMEFPLLYFGDRIDRAPESRQWSVTEPQQSGSGLWQVRHRNCCRPAGADCPRPYPPIARHSWATDTDDNEGMPAMTYRFDRRQVLLGGAAATGALALGGCAVVPRSDAGNARTLYDRISQAMLRGSPEMATGLGLDTGANADLRARLGPSGPEGKMGAYKPLVEQLPALRRMDGGGINGREKAFLDTILWLGERVEEVSQTPYGTFDGYPVPYVLSQLTGSYQSVPDFLDSQHKIETHADAEAYVSRLEAFARNVDLEVAQARADAGRGVVPPDFIIDKTIIQTRALREQHGEG